MTRRNAGRLWLVVMLCLCLTLPAMAEKDREQRAIDRAWLYLTEQAKLPGDLLYEPSYQRLTPTNMEPATDAELVIFRSAISQTSYLVYMAYLDGSLLLAEELDLSRGFPVTCTLLIKEGIRLVAEDL